MDEARDRLAAAHGMTGELVWSVPADGWARPTPCEGWDVADLVRHLVSGERIFAGLVSSGEADRATVFPQVLALSPDELPAAYAEAAGALRAAYAEPGALERSIVLPIGELPGGLGCELRTIESLTHAWDLGRALGVPVAVDDDLVEHAIGVSQALLERVPPDRPVFGTPQPVSPQAPALDRLAALLGRSVT